MGFVVAWILWSGLIDDHNWVLYSVVDRAVNYLPCLDRAQGRIWIRPECALNPLVR